MAKVMQSANEVLKTFALKSQVTVIDVIDAAGGPRGMDTYNMMLNETYQEIAYRSDRNEDVSRTWRLINQASAKIQKIASEKDFNLQEVQWRSRVLYDRSSPVAS